MNLEQIEAVFILMEKYFIDELQCEEFTIKKSKFKAEKKELTEQELLARHLVPLETEPWNDLPQDQVDAWAQGQR